MFHLLHTHLFWNYCCKDNNLIFCPNDDNLKTEEV